MSITRFICYLLIHGVFTDLASGSDSANATNDNKVNDHRAPPGFDQPPGKLIDFTNTSASSCCGVTQHLAIKGIFQIEDLMPDKVEDENFNWRTCQLTCKGFTPRKDIAMGLGCQWWTLQGNACQFYRRKGSKVNRTVEEDDGAWTGPPHCGWQVTCRDNGKDDPPWKEWTKDGSASIETTFASLFNLLFLFLLF